LLRVDDRKQIIELDYLDIMEQNITNYERLPGKKMTQEPSPEEVKH
jgi:hypothetical protein